MLKKNSKKVVTGNIDTAWMRFQYPGILLETDPPWKVSKGYQQPLTTFNVFEEKRSKEEKKNYLIKYSRNFDD